MLLSHQEAVLLRLVRDGWTVKDMADHVGQSSIVVRAALRALAARLRRF